MVPRDIELILRCLVSAYVLPGWIYGIDIYILILVKMCVDDIELQAIFVSWVFFLVLLASSLELLANSYYWQAMNEIKSSLSHPLEDLPLILSE